MNKKHDTVADNLLELLTSQAGMFYPEFSSSNVTVELADSFRRVFCSLYEFVLTDQQIQKKCFVKVINRADDLPEHIRQRRSANGIDSFLPRCDPPGHEYDSLLAIERHFGRLNDVRLDSLRTRGTILNNHAFVMDKAEAVSLSELMRQTSFGRDFDNDNYRSVKLAGEWLREFHGMEAPTHTKQQYDGLATLEQELDTVLDFLRSAGVKLDELATTLKLAISKLDDDDLQLGVHHGDFAPRNILVFSDQRIAAIDTLAEEFRPIFEDMTQFLVNLRTNKLQAVCFGLAFSIKTLAQLEKSFLEGYFRDEPIPWAYIRVFEARTLLISWAVMLWEQKHVRNATLINRTKYATRIFAIRKRLKTVVRDLSAQFGTSRGRCQPDKEAWRFRFITEALQQRVSNDLSHSMNRDPIVSFQGHTENKFSSILRYQIKLLTEVKQLVVKLPKNPLFVQTTSDTPVADRPRLTISMPPQEEIRLERVAMKRIEEHFGNLADPRLQAVKIFDFLPHHAALVMEQVDAITLADILTSRCSQDRDKNQIFSNVGNWLREFHQMPIDQALERDLSAEDFKQNLGIYAEFMQRRIGWRDWFLKVQNRVGALVGDGALDVLEIGTNHGDFAPQNVLVGRQGQIKVIDTLARWRKPIYEDIAHFLCVLLDSKGTGQDAEWRTSRMKLLLGYFGEQSIPHQKIALFQLLIFFDKWCSHVFSQAKATGVRKFAKRTRLLIINRKMRRRIDSILTQIEQSVSTSRKV